MFDYQVFTPDDRFVVQLFVESGSIAINVPKKIRLMERDGHVYESVISLCKASGWCAHILRLLRPSALSVPSSTLQKGIGSSAADFLTSQVAACHKSFFQKREHA